MALLTSYEALGANVSITVGNANIQSNGEIFGTNATLTGDIAANNIGNITPVNLDGNVGTVLSGGGTWLEQVPNAATLDGYSANIGAAANTIVLRDDSGNIVGNNITSVANMVVQGNLQVLGTTTTINANTLTINDKDIVIANGATSNSQANSAGIIVGNNVANIVYLAGPATDTWNLSDSLVVNGDISGNNIVGNSLTVPGSDDSLVVGSDTDTSPAGTITIRSAGSTFNGMLIRSSGFESWFIGRDNTSNVGNLVISSNQQSIMSMTSVSNNRTLMTLAGDQTVLGNLNANNIGATAVFTARDANINGLNFPFVLWDANSSGNINYNPADVGIISSGGNNEIWLNNTNQTIVLSVRFSIITTGTFTANIAAGYVSVSNDAITTNLALTPGTSFNSQNYYGGSVTFALRPGVTPGRFSVRLNVPGGNATGNVTANSRMIVTRIR